VRLIDPVDDMDLIFAQTRVLLVPSLWAEAKANVITEAMLRGIPVLASDAGGNREALLGVDYLLPVTPITRFTSPLRLDERMLPVADVPPQDIGPWRDALAELLASPASYQRVSRAARAAALAANEENTAVPFERHLEQLRSRRSGHSSTSAAPVDDERVIGSPWQ
jgi:glycosyltransferase involved in cell wall biosynthesis